jgi:hypothetical protein
MGEIDEKRGCPNLTRFASGLLLHQMHKDKTGPVAGRGGRSMRKEGAVWSDRWFGDDLKEFRDIKKKYG